MRNASGYKPLYRQVHDVVIQKIAEGVWRPGESLPSEQALAAELGVSQGTVRKVLDALTADNLLERRQGKGTFIAENTQARALYRFFRTARPGGERLTPASAGGETAKIRASRAEEQAKLDLGKSSKVIEINRVRMLEGVPAIREKIVLPAALFPGLETRRPLVNTLYSLYQTEYGIHITSAHEELYPALATEADARDLPVKVGAPLLCIDRLALSLNDLKVEWRVSRQMMNGSVYAVTLS